MPKKERTMKNSVRGKTLVKRQLVEKDKNDDNQVYGIIVKPYGSSVFEVRCYDGKTRKCIARQTKKKMFAEIGHIVIVGVRNFLGNDDTGDIIYVYDLDEARILLKNGSIPSDKGESMLENSEEVDTAFDFADI